MSSLVAKKIATGIAKKSLPMAKNLASGIAKETIANAVTGDLTSNLLNLKELGKKQTKSKKQKKKIYK